MNKTETREYGAELIAAERGRQRYREGFTPEHDELHDEGELAQAGNCYRSIGNGSLGHNTADADQSDAAVPSGWPWAREWWKPKTRLRNLVRAGALYQAEIDRLTRLRWHVEQQIDALQSVETSETTKP